MSGLRAVTFIWTHDRVMKPLRHLEEICERQFVVGEAYRLNAEDERYAKARGWYFACLHEAWRNLPDEMRERFITTRKLRKWLLVSTFWATSSSYVYSNPVEAERFRREEERQSEDCVIVVKGNIATKYIAMSQRPSAMKMDVFMRSAHDVLGYAAKLIGVDPETLYANTDMAA